MKTWREAIRDGQLSGALASAATAAAAMAFGRAETGSAAAPLNAVSHILWGDRAARHDEADVQHTAPGLALNHAAAVFWATIYEKLFGQERRPSRMLLGGAAVAALAYVVDYHLVPKRLTPGYEKRLSPQALFGVYVALALALAASGRARSAQAAVSSSLRSATPLLKGPR